MRLPKHRRQSPDAAPSASSLARVTVGGGGGRVFRIARDLISFFLVVVVVVLSLIRCCLAGSDPCPNQRKIDSANVPRGLGLGDRPLSGSVGLDALTLGGGVFDLAGLSTEARIALFLPWTARSCSSRALVDRPLGGSAGLDALGGGVSGFAGRCVHACVRCVHACVRACINACVGACVRACVRACVHECMRSVARCDQLRRLMRV